MRMDTTPGPALRECSHEERRALRWLQCWRRAQVDPVLGIELGRDGEDVDVGGFHEFFLHAGRREVDEVAAWRSE